MNLLARLFRSPMRLEAARQTRLDAWAELPEPPRHQPIASMRFIVLDTESTGLDSRRDRPLSIGAVTVDTSRIRLDQTFVRVLRQDRVLAHDNVVIHGIGPSAQAQGHEPADALLDFLAFAGKAPLVAYHAPFDRELLTREARRCLNVRLGADWLDLAFVLPALFPEARLPRAALDEWLAHFRLAVPDRHRADVDAFMTAELLLVALKQAQKRGITDYRELSALARVEAQYKPAMGCAGF